VLSALTALRRKTGDEHPHPELEGDFPALEAIIAEELTRARAREIKRRNLDALVERLLERAAVLVPEGTEERIGRWRRAAERVCEEVREDLAKRLAAAVRDDDALRHEIAARYATARYGGLFGFWQALIWGVRGLRGQGFMPAARRLAISEAALLGTAASS